MDWIKKNKGLLVLIIITSTWVLGSAYLLIQELNDEDFYYTEMSLNELGDFLAGAFSPLAFLWLVYGYWLQGRELKYTRLNLENQLIDFKNSVTISEKNFSLQESIHKKNLDEKRRMVMPIFVETEFEIEGKEKLLITMKNIGESVKNVYTCNNNIKFRFSHLNENKNIDSWKTLEKKTLSVITESNLDLLSNRALSFTPGNFEHVTIAKEISIHFIGNDNSHWSVKASILGALYKQKLTIDITFDEVNGHLNAHRVGETK